MIPKLKPFTNYTVQVTAINNNEFTSDSAVTPFTTQATSKSTSTPAFSEGFPSIDSHRTVSHI